MKKGKYLIFGLFPLAISAALLQSVSRAASAASVGRDRGQEESTVAPPPAAAQQNQYEASQEDMVNELAFSNADPREVIGLLEQLTGRTALVEQKLPTAKISLEIQEPISRIEAIAALESVLSLNGIAVVDMGEKFMKVVTAKTALTQSPDVIDESLLGYEPNQKVFSKFFTLKYLDANEVQRLIKPMLTPISSNSIILPAANSLFITDTMTNLQNVENLIRRIDTPIQMREAVNFIPLNNVKASAIVKKFDQLKRGAFKKYFSMTAIDSDDSSNQLIVVTPEENFPIIQRIAGQLDNKCDLLLKSEVLRIKHGDAKKIADIVSGIIKEQRSRIEKENRMAFERQQAKMTAQGNLAQALAQAAHGARSNQQISNTYSDFISSQQVSNEGEEEQFAHFSANLTLSSDERSNSIIVYGTASDLAQVRALVNDLDVLLDQVRIEVIVAQVTLTEGQQSGIDALNLGFNQNSTADATIPINRKHDISFSSAIAGGSSFKGTLRNFALETVLKQAKTDSNVKILSTPTLVTTHNRKAQFKIGEDRPFVDSSVKGDTVDAKERIQITYKHVGLELIVTPLIGSNGIIQMEIEQKVSKHNADVAIGGTTAPVISDKQINSFVSVANEDVIVLAGFKEKQHNQKHGKMFILGDIPILGDALFSSKTRQEETVELIIFIKPTIILHPQDEATYLDKRLQVTNFKDDIEYYKLSGDFPASKPFPKDTIIGLNAETIRPNVGTKKRRKPSVPANNADASYTKAAVHKEVPSKDLAHTVAPATAASTSAPHATGSSQKNKQEENANTSVNEGDNENHAVTLPHLENEAPSSNTPTPSSEVLPATDASQQKSNINKGKGTHTKKNDALKKKRRGSRRH
ncbi:MAG: hypothetical protein LBB11_01860 [Puniceicoccales bacterium]|nr:hypothetical protein [Puniceicoccales bacterium]